MATLAPDSGRVAALRADSGRAAKLSKEEMNKIFVNMPTEDIVEIIKITNLVDKDPKDSSDFNKAINNSGKSSTFQSRFKEKYKERIGPQTAATKAWKYYIQIKGI